MENYLDCEKLAHVIQHGLQKFIVENIEGKPTEANDLSHILWKWVCCVNNSKRYLATCSQNFILQEVFETVAQMMKS